MFIIFLQEIRIYTLLPVMGNMSCWLFTDFQSNTKKARYDSFSVKDASTNYQLDVSGFSGDAGW